MNGLISLTLQALLLAPSTAPPPSPPAADAKAAVVIFLVDNSASLPPLDPQEKRVTALEKMFTYVDDQRHRLVLFGGRREISVDKPEDYKNNGQWTDFCSAFERVRDVMREYPPGTEFRIVMVTDGVLDPDPKEWADVGLEPDGDLKTHVTRRLLGVVAELDAPLYIIMVVNPGTETVDAGGGERVPAVVLQMVLAANGRKASPTAQKLSAFFKDDGLLVKKFIFRVEPHEGLAKVEPVVRRILTPPSAKVEVQIASAIGLPSFLFLALLLGILVRSFPGPGDLEIIELTEGLPIHLGVDRARKIQGGWATTGLSLQSDARDAAGTLTWQRPSIELTGVGLAAEGLDAITQQLLPLPLDELRTRLEGLADVGTKEEKIYALNLDYMAKNLDAGQAEKLLTTPLAERRRLPVLDFLRAKAHLISNYDLRRRLTEPRAQFVGYGKDGERKELKAGGQVRIGRYGFLVKDLATGGRRDARVVLYYDRVPSVLGLKSWLPDFFQRLFRMRRSSQRVVS